MDIQPGTYRAKPVEHKFGSTQKGAEQVLVTFEIAAGDHKGQRLFWYGYFTDKAVERTLESLEHCGWDGVSISALKGFGSKEVNLVVEHETGQDGKQYVKVRWVNAIGGGLKKELDRGGILALEEKLKGIILARKLKKEENGDDSFSFGANAGDDPPV